MGNHSSDPYPFFINTNLRALQRITEGEKRTEEHESYCKDEGNSRKTTDLMDGAGLGEGMRSVVNMCFRHQALPTGV